MDWQQLVDEGIVHPAPSSHVYSLPTIKRAWECVVEAREAYLSACWERADREVKNALCVATEALVFYHEFSIGGTCELDVARRIGIEYFGERLGGPIFENAEIIGRRLSLADEAAESDAKAVRRSIAASSEYVALVECFTNHV